MSQGRITCSRCGSNNFDTVTACWKCSNPLSAGAAPQPDAAAYPNVTAYATPAPTNYPMGRAEGVAYNAAATAVNVSSTLGNAAASNRAAFWLGITMPYFGLPIGLAFIMCDDRRRQEVGRLCVMWSLLSGVIHMLLMFVTALGMRQMFSAFLGSAMSGMKNGGSGGLGGGGIGGGGLGGDGGP